MHIGMLLDHRFPGDMRVEREAAALLEAGHEVSILFFAGGAGSTPFGHDLSRMNLIQAPYPESFLSRAWLKLFKTPGMMAAHGRRLGFEAVHVHDLPLAWTGLRAARRLGVPLVLDLHENYPGLVLSWGRFRRFKSRLWAAYEKWATSRAARVITVIEENRDRLVGRGVRPEKLAVVPNSEDPAIFDQSETDPELLKKYEGRRVATYLGSFGPHRGLDTAVEATARLKERFPDLLLLIVGDRDPAEMAKLKALVEKLDLKDHVELTGWQPFSKVPTYCRASYLGLVPHRSTPHTESTMPNKIHNFLFCHRPVIVSDIRPLKRLCEAHRFGLVFKAGDPVDLADKMARLLDEPGLAEELARTGEDWARNEGSWLQQKTALIDLYRQLEQERPQ